MTAKLSFEGDLQCSERMSISGPHTEADINIQLTSGLWSALQTTAVRKHCVQCKRVHPLGGLICVYLSKADCFIALEYNKLMKH